MIDLHSHILPGLDDGAPDMATSLEMARIAVEDGIRIIACTPHFTPGVYNTLPETIGSGVANLRSELEKADIKLHLVAGCDAHVMPDMVAFLNRSPFYRLHGTRYFLFEPPHHIVPPNLDALATELIEAGFIPVLTHPERLSWAHKRYDLIEKINDLGCLVQITAGSITGTFGERSKNLAMKMLNDGRVDIIASDAHNLTGRPPKMSAARAFIASHLGEDEAQKMTYERPLSILRNEVLEPVCRQGRLENVNMRGGKHAETEAGKSKGFWQRFGMTKSGKQ